MIYCGYFNGLERTSPFSTVKFEDVNKAMLFVKAHMDFFKTCSYGFSVFTDEQVKVGRHYIQKRLMSWYLDGTECGGELINRDLGWRIYIDALNQIVEEHFIPKGD